MSITVAWFARASTSQVLITQKDKDDSRSSYLVRPGPQSDCYRNLVVYLLSHLSHRIPDGTVQRLTYLMCRRVSRKTNSDRRMLLNLIAQLGLAVPLHYRSYSFEEVLLI